MILGGDARARREREEYRARLARRWSQDKEAAQAIGVAPEIREGQLGIDLFPRLRLITAQSLN
jgi:hypothetical protein